MLATYTTRLKLANETRQRERRARHTWKMFIQKALSLILRADESVLLSQRESLLSDSGDLKNCKALNSKSSRELVVLAIASDCLKLKRQLPARMKPLVRFSGRSLWYVWLCKKIFEFPFLLKTNRIGNSQFLLCVRIRIWSLRRPKPKSNGMSICLKQVKERSPICLEDFSAYFLPIDF